LIRREHQGLLLVEHAPAQLLARLAAYWAQAPVALRADSDTSLG